MHKIDFGYGDPGLVEFAPPSPYPIKWNSKALLLSTIILCRSLMMQTLKKQVLLDGFIQGNEIIIIIILIHHHHLDDDYDDEKMRLLLKKKKRGEQYK